MHTSATSIALKVIRLDLAVGIVPYQTTLHSERILPQGFHPNARSTIVIKSIVLHVKRVTASMN